MVKDKDKSLKNLSDVLGVKFKDKSLLDKALVHRSYASQHQIAKDNERLEYLGDSILNACVTDFLYHRFPEKNEGDLTKIRARLVSRRKLKEWGAELNLKDYIFLGEDVEKYVGEGYTHIVEDTLEAIIGAIYLDRGFKTVYRFIEKYIKQQDFYRIFDFKSKLQEYSLNRYKTIPAYNIIRESGPPHQRTFVVQVEVNGRICGEGLGGSKKEAQQNAAKQAFEKLETERN
ncbi:MAG: ribonuclease III [Elusimicrobia bacterium]|nr:ribonuclease III [Elusimicrobiota bacterium]